MLRSGSLPVSLMRVLEPFQPCFSAPSFTTFVMLVAGLAARPAGRTVVVRWPYTDMRAEDMLDAEAKQLPTDSPGMVMIQTSGAVGAMKAWRGSIQNRFQPTLHTRVSAVCLFTSSVNATESGEKWQPECKLILNPYARHPLPGWIVDQLEQFPSHEIDI